MEFNLIEEQWIPVLRRDGTPDMIAPHEVTDRFAENPVVSLKAPRPDFNGALIQFLIGLVQTVAAPQSGAEWRKRLTEPPTPEELKGKFDTVRHVFELAGDGPRFMQDFSELTVDQGDIDGLLIDMPGESTTKKNTDHFVKRNTVVGMCPSCSATALFAMQTNAPAGGQGNRTSLRGGGPLTTVVIGDTNHATLWQMIWLNTLEDRAFLNICGAPTLSHDSAKFPWMSATKTSEKDAGACLPNDFHPSVMYWGMPRRIRLCFDDLISGQCDACGKESETLIKKYQQKNFGMNFLGAWLHPLSPYNAADGSEPLPSHPQPGGVTYRHWLGLIQSESTDRKMPARVVHDFIQHRQKDGWQFRVLAFGYDMKNMNARCWYESQMPLLFVDPSFRQTYEDVVAGMVKAAVIVGENLRIALKNAIHGKAIFDPITRKLKWEYRDIKKLATDEEKRRAKVLYETREDTALISVESDFWQNTEPQFYGLLSKITRSFSGDAITTTFLEDWHSCLCNEAQRLFDLFSWEIAIEDSDPKRIVIARNEMRKHNRGSYVKKLLGI